MIISDLEKRDDGSYDMNVKASKDEMKYLMNFAVNNLMLFGIISLTEDQEGEQEVEFLSKIQRTMN